MAIVGYFKNLSEAQKLVQDKKLLPGVVQEIYEEGALLKKLPVFAIDSKSIVFNREQTLPSADFYDIHEQIPWQAETDYTDQVEVTLKRCGYQTILDNFIMSTYKNPNDYKSQILSELRKGCMRTIEDKLIYGNNATYPKEPDGLVKLVTTAQRTNEASALSLANIRAAIDSVKPKPDLIICPYVIQRRLDAALWEAGISANSLVRVPTDANNLGERLMYFEGIPVMASDYLVAEAADGIAKWTTGTKYYSIWLLRFGQIPNGGLCLAVGGGTGGTDFFKFYQTEKLENYDAGGMSLFSYMALANGSTKCIHQIYAITDAAVTA